MSLEAAVDNLAKVADDLVDRLDAIAEILKSVHALERDVFGIALQRDKLHEFAAAVTTAPPAPNTAPPAPNTAPPAPNTAPPAPNTAPPAPNTAPPAPNAAPLPGDSINPNTLDYSKHVQPALLRLAAKKGRQALVDLLKAHGVSKGADLPAASYAAVVVAAEALLDEAAS